MDTARTKRLMLVELLIFLSLAGTTALVFQPLMAVINKNITVVQEKIIKQGEMYLDRPIRYGSMSPSLIGKIELRDFIVGTAPYPLASVDYLYLEYSLWDLIRGKGAGAIRSLILEKPELFYDTVKDSDLKDIFSGKTKKKPSLPRKCLFIVQDGTVSFSNGNIAVSTREVFLNGKIEDGLVSLEGLWKKNPSLDAITLEGSVKGSFSQQFNQGTIGIYVDSVSGNSFSVNRVGFNLSFFEDRIIFERENDGLPLELFGTYHYRTGKFFGFFSADRFLPASMVHFSGGLEKLSPLLDLGLSGSASLSLENSLSYSFMFKGENRYGQTASGGNLQLAAFRGFSFEGNGNEHQVDFSQFSIEANRGSVNYSGDIQLDRLHPQGLLVFSEFSMTGDNSISGMVSFSRTIRGLSFYSNSLTFGETVLTSFGGDLTNLENRADYIFGLSCYHDGNEGPIRASFESKGSLTGIPKKLEGTADFTNFYGSDIFNMVRPFFDTGPPVKGLAQNTSLTTEIFFSTDFSSLQYNSRNFIAKYGSSSILSVSISGTEKQVTLNNGIVFLRQGQLEFDAGANFSNSEDITIKSRISYFDYNYEFEGRIRNRNTVTVRSNHDISITIVNEDGFWSGSATGKNIPIPYFEHRANVSFNAMLDYYDSSAWNCRLLSFEIKEVQGPSELFIRGLANQNGLNLDRVYFTNQAGPLEGSAAAIWNRDFSVIDASFFLGDKTETEKLGVELFYESGTLEFYGNISDFNGERFFTGGKNLKISGDFNGGIFNDGHYLLNFTLTSLSGFIGDKNFFLSGRVLVEPARIVLSQIFTSVGGMQANIPYVSLDKDTGQLETEAQINAIVNKQRLGVLMSLTMDFQPLSSWLDTDSLSSLSGVLTIHHAYINNRETPNSFNFNFSRTPLAEQGTRKRTVPAIYQISGGLEDMLYAEFRENSPGNGIFSVSLGNPSPVQGFITGILEGTTIDALASEVFIDFAGLWEIIPITKIVEFTGGTITGEARVFGSIYDPEFEGKAWASGVRLTVPEYVAAEIGPGSGNIILENSGMSFGPVDAPCGNGHGIVSGWVRFNRWIASLGIFIEVDRDIPFDFDILGVMAKGTAKGTFDIVLEEEALLTLTGNIDANDTVITLNKEEIEFAFSGTNRNVSLDVEADVKISADKWVEFLWPNSRTPLLRAYGEAKNGVRLLGDTRIPKFSMDGNVFLRGGEMYHLQRRFYIREGVLEFSGTDPSINPLVSAVAEIRDRNDDGPVTIAMVVDKVPLSEFEKTLPRYTSTPALSQLEIFSLLGQAPAMEDTTRQEPLNPFVTAAISLSSVSDMIIQTVIFRRVEQEIRSIFGLDMLSFRTQILQNTISEAVKNRDPNEQPAGMGNYLDNTSVFIGKYIGPDLFFQANFAFRYDQYQKKYSGMKLEPDIGFDLRTPLFAKYGIQFDVRWNLPLRQEYLRGNDLLTHFVSDQSLSLVWRWSL